MRVLSARCIKVCNMNIICEYQYEYSSIAHAHNLNRWGSRVDMQYIIHSCTVDTTRRQQA